MICLIIKTVYVWQTRDTKRKKYSGGRFYLPSVIVPCLLYPIICTNYNKMLFGMKRAILRVELLRVSKMLQVKNHGTIRR